MLPISIYLVNKKGLWQFFQSQGTYLGANNLTFVKSDVHSFSISLNQTLNTPPNTIDYFIIEKKNIPQ